MTRAELAVYFPQWCQPFFYDTTYAKPKLAWLTDKFWPWFKNARWKSNTDKWTRKNDCDNFARAYCVFAQDAHADTPLNDDEGLAVGEFCYVRSSGEAHAIVVALTDVGLVYIEPQTGEVLGLTPQEKSSCFRVSF